MVDAFELCPKLCFLQADNIACQSLLKNICKGACEEMESAEDYNKKVKNCISYLEKELPTFALLDDGLEQEEQSCILVENGRFYGMGYLPQNTEVREISDVKYRLTPYAENDYIRGMIFQYSERYPTKKVLLNNQVVQ
jgi:DNA polymerase-3 subunit epsilon